jgi:D-tyrosyl-tRNA(Tyr) deacylase
MRLVVQRVSRAEVLVAGRVHAAIGTGLLLLTAVEAGDGEAEVDWMADKVVNLRIFPDDQQRMNRSVKEIGGEILSVSQFTLASRIGRGRRPDFIRAAGPQLAQRLYERFNERLAQDVPVRSGVFGAMMEVRLVNDGPVTFVVERQAAGEPD